MEYTIEFDEANGICIIRVTGKHRRPKDSMALQELARDFINERGCFRFLIDMSQAQIFGGTMDTYITGTVPVDKDLEMKRSRHRVALVYSSIDVEQNFLEDVAVNKGYNLKVFEKFDEALEWLKTD